MRIFKVVWINAGCFHKVFYGHFEVIYKILMLYRGIDSLLFALTLYFACDSFVRKQRFLVILINIYGTRWVRIDLLSVFNLFTSANKQLIPLFQINNCSLIISLYIFP